MAPPLIDAIFNRLSPDETVPFRVRIFRLISATTAVLTLALVLPMNLLLDLPMGVNVLTILLGLLAVFCAWMSYRGRHYVAPFLVIAIAMLDVAWFWNAGSQGSISFYFFPILLFALALFHGRCRWALAGGLLLNACALYVIENQFPGLVTPFKSPLDRLLDLVTGVVGGFAALTGVAVMILESHDREQQRIAQIAAKLAESEQKYREIFNATNDAMFVHDTAGRLVDLNEAACSLFGFDRATGLRLSFNDCSLGVTPYSATEAQRFVQAALASGPQVFEWRSRRPNGELFWSEVALRACEIAGERRVIAAVRDISERKRAAEQLHANEQRLRLSMEASRNGWFEMNVQTGEGVSSPEYIRMIGFEPAGFKTTLQGWLEGVHPNDREELIGTYRAAIVADSSSTMEYRRRTKEGSWKWIRSVGRVVDYDPDGKPLRMYGTHSDITERKELEERLLHSQRLEAVGTLASGVAHDLNNILTPVLMASGVLQEKLKDPRDRELMSMLHNGGKRGAAIVKQLLAFSRNMTGDLVVVDPRNLIRETAQLMRSTLPKGITVIERCVEDVGRIQAEPTQMHQVLVNLCINARDAMPEGGTLTFELAQVNVPAPPASHIGAPGGGTYLVISVGDTGCGIPPEYMERVFDPFFTTKETGKGTGLGLATVHGIVKAHRGFVRADSSPGRGAVFRVFLPALTTSSTAIIDTPPAPRLEAPKLTPRGCILLVEDDASVRLATQRRLEAAGFRILAASGGAEALQVLREAAADVQLVVTDFSMPLMDGPTLVPLLRQIVPTLRVIGVSGNDQETRSAELKAIGFAEVLSKPYEAGELIEAINRQLPACSATE
jgi:PAS domain S-box-containing protein